MTKLLHHKHIPRASGLIKGKDRSMNLPETPETSLDARRAYHCLLTVEELLRQALLAQGAFPGGKLPKTLLRAEYKCVDGSSSAPLHIESAVDVLHLGKMKGWIK